MGKYIIKVVLSSIIIVAVSEVSKKSSLIGSILASIPLVSVLAIIWLYLDTGNAIQSAKLAKSVFYMVIPSLSFFAVFPYLIKLKLNFYPAMFISLTVMVLLYFLMAYVLQKVGVNF